MRSRAINYFLVLVFTPIILAGCGTKQSLDDAQNTSVQFVQDMINGEYEKPLSKINWDQEHLVKDSVINYFEILRYRVQSEFGKEVTYKSLGCQQNILLSKTNNEKTEMLTGEPGVKYCLVQISDKYHFSIFRLSLGKDNKILSIDMSNDIFPIPHPALFWVIGVVVMLCIFAFNVFVLIRIYKSDVTRKWLKCLMVVFLNFPVIGFKLMHGFYFTLFSLPIMGVGFSINNYLDSHWSFGLPLGAIVVFWRIKNNLYRTQDDDLFYVEAADQSNSE